MRKLFWFTLGFAAACFGGSFLHITHWLIPIAAVAGFLSLCCWYLTQWKRELRVAAVIFLGILTGLLWFRGYYAWRLAPLEELHNQTLEVTLEVTDYSWETDYGIAGEAVYSLDGKNYKTRFYLNEKMSLLPGDRVHGEFRMVSTAESERNRYQQGAGIFLLAYPAGEITCEPSESLPLRYYPRYLYLRLTTLADAIFPEDTAVFVKALLVGEDYELDYKTGTDLNISGIRHIIAVSGMHITILFSVLSFLVGRRRFLLALLGIPVLLLFSAVVGFTPSVTRACIMQIMILLAMLLNREEDRLTALALSALVMLAVNPLMIQSVSFQLSVCCMLGIFTVSPILYDWLMADKRLGRWRKKHFVHSLCRGFASSVSMSLGATVFTTPLSALHFGSVSLIGVVTNLLTIWLVTALFCAVLIICLLGLILPGVAGFLAGIAAWAVRFILAVSRCMAAIPLSAVYTRNPAVTVWLTVMYILLAVFILWKLRRPGYFAAAGVLSLCAALLIGWLTPMGSGARLTVLDVGQGQCILYQAEGKAFLVDCGGSYDDDAADAAAETLLSQGIGYLDGLILTHYDRDHAGGVSALLSRIPADQIYLPDMPDPSGYRQEIDRVSSGQQITVSQDAIVSYGSVEIHLFAMYAGKGHDESSMCILFQTENCDILITGDNDAAGERRLMERFDLPDLEVLIAGHHGSKNATSEELLRKCAPDTVIISVGEYNSYGHPSGEVLERLEAAGCQVYRTDLDGTVIYKG